MSGTVLVTGATGFVGSALLPVLSRAGWRPRAALRRAEDAGRLPPGTESVVVGDIGPDTDWSRALDGAAAVVHLAARAHRPRDGREEEGEYMRLNAEATAALGRAAAGAGARLVFLSSVKAGADAGRSLDESSADPTDAYGRSKLAAERALAAVPGLSWAALRSPLCYGPGAKANFRALARAVAAGWPLPLGCASAARSLLFVGNLASAVVFLLGRRETGVFMVRDGEDLSAAELSRRLGAVLGRPARLWPCPAALLRAALAALGRSAAASSLLDELTVDDRRLRALGWAPPFAVAEGLARSAGGSA